MMKLTGTDAWVFLGSWIGFLLVCAVLYAIPVWILWNWLVPTIFGLSKITLFQAWGLSFLSALLIKSSSTTSSNTTTENK